MAKMSGQIFISYRRDDSAASAGRLYDHLLAQFPNDQIFIDVDLDPGIDFLEAIEASVGSCDVLIAVIGKNWLLSTDEAGKRRLDNKEDFVRLEIATALKRSILVIPVLVEAASMPRSYDLPDDLKPLARRNALEVSHSRFNADFGRLVTAIEAILDIADAEHEQREEARTPMLPTPDLEAVAAFKRGNVFLEKKDYNKAIRDYSEAIRLDRNLAWAYNNRGRAYQEKKKYDKAINDYDEAIRLVQNFALAYSNRGSTYHDKKDYDKAISDFNEAIRLDRNFAWAYIYRGRAYQEKKDYYKAIDDFNEAIRLDRDFTWAYENRGNLYQRQMKLDKAQADFAKVDELKRAGKYCNP
jgi:tetratricopeptide (TPR) repeat protein